MLSQLPDNAEELISAQSRGHVMGMKMRKSALQGTASAIEIDLYDPGLGMVLNLKGKSKDDFKRLMMQFVLPRLHWYFDPGRDVALTMQRLNGKTNSSGKRYIEWDNALHHAEIFGQAAQYQQFELISDMIDDIKATKSTDYALKMLRETVLKDGNNPLCGLVACPSAGPTLVKIMELMHWARMAPEESTHFLTTKSPLQDPIAIGTLNQNNADLTRLLLQGLEVLNIRGKLALDVLDARQEEGASGVALVLSKGLTQTLNILIDGLIELGVTKSLAYQLFDSVQHDGLNPIMNVLAFGHADMLELLLKRLPELGIEQGQLYEMLKRRQHGSGTPGLGFPMEFGHTQTVDILLGGLADFQFPKERTLSLLNQAAHNGSTPLGLMLQFGRAETLEVVLRHLPKLGILGEDAFALWIEAKTHSDESALLKLCEQGDSKTLEILLKGLPTLGIDNKQASKLLEVRNHNGQNAIDIARQAGHQHIVKLLEAHLSS